MTEMTGSAHSANALRHSRACVAASLALVAALAPAAGCSGPAPSSDGPPLGTTLGATAQALAQASYEFGDFTVNVDNRDPALSEQTILDLVNTFFILYPHLRARYNPDAPLDVDFVFTPSHPYPASAWDNEITFSSTWMIDHPQDWDIVTHESMHVVQFGSSGPGWLIEGIADHVRNEYGVNNAAAGWQLTDDPSKYYNGGYGHTALFLIWVEQHYRASLVDDLTSAMLDGVYSEQTWVTLTGKTVEQLWNEYRPWFPIPTDRATLFQDIDYGGSGVSLTPGSYALSSLLALGVDNDWVSSLWVPAGLQVQLFSDDNFGGSVLTFTANDPSLLSFGANDTTSSVIISRR